MSRGPCRFRQTDITRAIRAVRNAGVAVARVEIQPDGRFVIVCAGEDAQATPRERNEWDDA